MKPFIHKTLYILKSKVLVILFGLFYSIITARFLGPELNGVLSSLLVYSSLMIAIGSLGVSPAVTHLIGKKKFSDDKITTGVVQIWFFSTIITTTLTFLLIYFTQPETASYLIVLTALIVPFALFHKFSLGIFLGKNRIRGFGNLSWIPTLFQLLTAILLIIFLDFKVSGALIAVLIGSLLISVLLLFSKKIQFKLSFHIQKEVIKSLLSLGIIYAFALLFLSLNYKVDIILLDHLSTNYETGIYTKGAKLAEYLWQIPMIFAPIVVAGSATSTNQKEYSQKIMLLLRVTLIIVLLIAIFIALLSHYIIIVLFGELFVESAFVLTTLLPGVVLLTLYKVLNMDLVGQGKPMVTIKAMIPALILNLILNWLWIPEFGAFGAALASTFSYALGAVLFLILYLKQTKYKLSEVFNFSKNDFKIVLGYLKR
ncbi:MAG: polysaccharide biosynthesis C-terminal domain-containing protein [Brumimicrobium sp.]